MGTFSLFKAVSCNNLDEFAFIFLLFTPKLMIRLHIALWQIFNIIFMERRVLELKTEGLRGVKT